MRQPTFRRRKTRQQRLMRTGIGIVVIIGLIAVVGNLLGEDGKPGSNGDDPEVPTVSFTATSKGFTNAGKAKRAAAVDKKMVTREADDIKKMLDEWYQQGWVDVEGFEDATFSDIADLFSKEAQVNFKTDIDSLTIGKGAADVTRVDPAEASTEITVYLEDGDKPTFAVAEVKFVAVGTPKRKGALPIDIEQTAKYHLEKTGDGWLVNFYEAKQTQEERVPPSPTPTASS